MSEKAGVVVEGAREERPAITELTPYEDLPEFLYVIEAAAWIRIPAKKLYPIIAEAGGPVAVRIGRRLRIPKRELRDWLKRNAG